MTSLFWKYGVNRMNLPYLDNHYKTTDLESAAEDWLLDSRKALLEAMNNGIVYFNESSKEKVDQHICELGGVDFLKRELTDIILRGEMRIDYLHRRDQEKYFGKFLLPWEPLCPICFIFDGVSTGNGEVYFKCRISKADKLAIDVHFERYTNSRYTTV